MGKFRIFVNLLTALFLVISTPALAVDTVAHFQFREIAPFTYDFESLYNDNTKVLTLKIGVVPTDLPDSMKTEPLSFSKAARAEVVFLDLPDLNVECHEVTQFHFEYNPDIPYQLLMVSLKGEGCGDFLMRSPIDLTRIRFINVPMPNKSEESFSLIIRK